MNDKLVAVIASAVLGVAFVAGMALHKAQIVTQNVAPQGTPVVVSGGTNGTPSNFTVNVPEREGGDQVFGVTNAANNTNWISGTFTEDLDVTGTTTLSGVAVGYAKSSALAMANSTTTACSFQNLTTSTRLIAGIGIVDRGVASSTGTIFWNVGTSSLAHLINGRSAASSSIARATDIDISLPTSTLNAAQANTSMTAVGILQWRKGEYLNFLSSTTSNQGRCILNEL